MRADRDPVELVIFDSDGVLVDSERIAQTVLAELARSEGAAMDTDEAVRIFRGMKMSNCVAEIERRSGRPVRETFVEEVRGATALAFERGLKPMDGVHAALAEIAVPICVASNGPMTKLQQTLALADLAKHFEGRVFSAYEVGSWKPDPGLFLHAAKTLGVHPSHCIVVEDSILGIEAANAAGMRCLGFACDESVEGELRDAGAKTFRHMSELSALLASL